MSIPGIGHSTAASYRPASILNPRAPAPLSEKASVSLVTDALPDDDDIGVYDTTGKVPAPSNSFETARANGYEIFMPTRAGYSSNNLALAVTDPAAEPFSAGLTKDQVANAARGAIDARYAQMSREGKPFDINSMEGVDWYAAFGDLDRRALNAIYTDKSGAFSEEEKGIAHSIMSQQQGLAIGLYGGPTRLVEKYNQASAAVTQSPEALMTMYKKTVEWLDKLSLEEKTTSPMWVDQRAGSQWGYEETAKGLGVLADDLSSGFSFIDMYIRSIRELGELGVDHTIEDAPSYGKVWELFDEYRSNLESRPEAVYV
ncbi:hypothetical protein [Neorhizobium galegae]|uniref:hypothetical protein n=1 Tax=Neorhizobium galegae TaxID=399 RepID=UPI00062207FD|nr:hypothetical protein [Neorhizobium galegae]CDZ27452.1 Hypothetical protein NGAL_HAMBI490_22980 [Neorhizobium galegae bv. officinalis]KAA9387206.1 hypothetical protein F4V88_12380 [Neorhizobium galegae]KAB1114352.1 hypothetical protein F4V89_08040 [Neorhizobium galegae]MCM2497462.1 hypothetical protein [Neorhizobium galegae]MCQ1771552.1 hypothetical protein [Neorhizobium galegae]